MGQVIIEIFVLLKETFSRPLKCYFRNFSQASSGNKNWFGFQQQRILGTHLAYEIAKLHANTMTPDEVVDYAIQINNKIYFKIIKGE